MRFSIQGIVETSRRDALRWDGSFGSPKRPRDGNTAPPVRRTIGGASLSGPISARPAQAMGPGRGGVPRTPTSGTYGEYPGGGFSAFLPSLLSDRFSPGRSRPAQSTAASSHPGPPPPPGGGQEQPPTTDGPRQGGLTLGPPRLVRRPGRPRRSRPRS